MTWAYIGDGCWELQGGLLLGCVYGSKFTNIVTLKVEKVVHTVRPNAVEVLWELKDVELTEYFESRMLVEAHMERLLRNTLTSLDWVR